MNQAPDVITLAHLECVVMPNGEVICHGRTLGWIAELGRFLTQKIDPSRPLPSKSK